LGRPGLGLFGNGRLGGGAVGGTGLVGFNGSFGSTIGTVGFWDTAVSPHSMHLSPEGGARDAFGP
jgi:hypothetical protein